MKVGRFRPVCRRGCSVALLPPWSSSIAGPSALARPACPLKIAATASRAYGDLTAGEV